MENTNGDKRRRGRRPGDADARRAAVERALRDLQDARAPFSMSDLAERAGISRATLYRDAGLRDLVGDKGEGPKARPVNFHDHEKLRTRVETLTKERRELRREVRDLKANLDDTYERLKRAEAEAAQTSQTRVSGVNAEQAEKIHREAYAEGFAAGTRVAGGRGSAPNARGIAGKGDLSSVAARLPKPALVNARRVIVRALHPDLYTNDPAAALLATELLKQLNAITGA